MKIHFLTEPLTDQTGGLIYDHNLYDYLVQKFGDKVKLIDDNCFSIDYANVKKNYRRFQKIYIKNLDDIFNCDYLFVNSRLYTRFINFPWTRVKKHNCKIIEIHHHFNFETHKGVLKMVHRKFELNFLSMANAIICPNPYTIDKLKYFNFENIKKLETLEIAPKITQDKNIVKKNQILFIGNVEARKGLTYGIKAFAELHKKVNNYEFIIAGKIKSGDEYLFQLKKLCEKLNVEKNVKFIGRISDKEKDVLLQESKIFLFPSQNEGYGLVMIEAMSYGLPVIAFDNTAMPYTVNDKNGYIVKNKDISQMAKALIGLCTNNNLYEKKVKGAFKTVLNLSSQEDIILQYDKFMNQLIEGKL